MGQLSFPQRQFVADCYGGFVKSFDNLIGPGLAKLDPLMLESRSGKLDGERIAFEKDDFLHEVIMTGNPIRQRLSWQQGSVLRTPPATARLDSNVNFRRKRTRPDSRRLSRLIQEFEENQKLHHQTSFARLLGHLRAGKSTAFLSRSRENALEYCLRTLYIKSNFCPRKQKSLTTQVFSQRRISNAEQIVLSGSHFNP